MVLDSVRRCGPSTRAEITGRLGVTFPTTAKAIASLLEAKLLEEYDDEQNLRGRPAKRVRLARTKSQVIGIELDHPDCKIVAAGFDGHTRPETLVSFRTPNDYESLLSEIGKHVNHLITQTESITLGIGLTIPGLVDYRKEQVCLSANLPILNNRPIGKDISTIVNVHCQMVHDTHALCMAESMYGKDMSAKPSFVMLAHRAGIGLGVMIDGAFLSGCDGFAGEIGHTPMIENGRPCSCGRSGCLETVASELALLEQASTHFGRDVDIEEYISLALSEDPFVMEALSEASQYLAMVIANVVNLLNPHRLYVNGRLFEELPWLLDHMSEQASQLALPLSFERCQFERAASSLIDGSIASVINHITDSLTPQVT
ncbi:N-acetylglucosamine repressor [Planctomycetes bacterium CA13]|uniref:N-acetylglucosamine repressor n=2 Tax=Novipirellula herctigrandis TaxID=2527986 RepID=A0A5C5YVH2_9BACT|nr:N-acetylglucosamine repressor [Planctomycetes bacterium CA13]